MLSNLHYREILPALGLGIVVGVGGAVASYRVRGWTAQSTNTRLDKLTASISSLQRELADLKDTFLRGSGTSSFRRCNSGYLSIHPSSGDEDDDFFEEAYDEAYEGFTNPPDALIYKDTEESNEFEGESDVQLVAFLRDIDNALLEESEQEETLRTLLENFSEYDDNVHFMWRVAKAHFLVARNYSKDGNLTQAQTIIFQGKDYAATAISIDEHSAGAHKWYGLLIGLATDYVSTKERIQYSYDFKDHMLRALELTPNDPYLYNYYGRYIYEIATLSWILRKAAAALFGEPPTGTIDEALDVFLKAEQLTPGFCCINAHYIGKCYLQKRDTKTAQMWFEKALALPSASFDELKAREETEMYVRKYL